MWSQRCVLHRLLQTLSELNIAKVGCCDNRSRSQTLFINSRQTDKYVIIVCVIIITIVGIVVHLHILLCHLPIMKWSVHCSWCHIPSICRQFGMWTSHLFDSSHSSYENAVIKIN